MTGLASIKYGAAHNLQLLKVIHASSIEEIPGTE